MAYIAMSDAVRLSRQTLLSGLDMSEPLYIEHIDLFSTHEKQFLHSFRELMRDPKTFFGALYAPVKPADTQLFVYELSSPAYHDSEICPHMQVDERRYLVPGEVRELGKSAVRAYRRWFKAVRHFLDEGKDELFHAHLRAKWDMAVSQEDILQNGEEFTTCDNTDIDILQHKIDQHIRIATLFIEQKDIHKTILETFRKATYLAYTSGPIRDNTTGYSDEIVKAVLNTFDTTFKRPLIRYLTEYYRLLYNPGLSYDSRLLVRAGLDQCTRCHGKDLRHPDQQSGKSKVYFEDILYLRSLNWKWEDVSGLN